MANRHLARTIVLQSLFAWDFYHQKKDIAELIERNKKNLRRILTIKISLKI